MKAIARAQDPELGIALAAGTHLSRRDEWSEASRAGRPAVGASRYGERHGRFW